MEGLTTIAEMISLALTCPTIVLSLTVVALWWPQCWNAMFTRHRDATQWFIIGVAVGFMGSTFDNAYWGVAWFAQMMNLESADFWFRNGVFSNIPFRQIAGTAAAYCHVRSAYAYAHSDEDAQRRDRARETDHLLLVSTAFGFIAVLVVAFFFIEW